VDRPGPHAVAQQDAAATTIGRVAAPGLNIASAATVITVFLEGW
jgi:hypothetical protein